MQRQENRRLWACWIALGAMLGAAALALALLSHRYWAGVPLFDMPSIGFSVLYTSVCLAFLLILPLLLASVRTPLGASKQLLVFMLAIGFLFRLVLMGSQPAFEDDWYRYLWDGAVSAHGYNPYAVSPDDAQGEPYHYTLQPLARQSGIVIERINYSDLRTVYPPVAQAAFALAYFIEPWSLTAWRTVLLVAELASVALLLMLLSAAGRPLIWAALYWWNPLVIKEVINSAHMEGIVTPLVLGALLLLVRQRPVAATGVLGLAAGAKLWPVMLLPLVLRPLIEKPARLAAALLLFAALLALWAWPVLAGGLDETSGFVAFAQRWRTNSAHFPLIESIVAAVLPVVGLDHVAAGSVARAMLAAAAGLAAVGLALRPIGGAGDVMTRAGLVTGILFLLSPAQFPWYAIWMIPYLCVRPRLGLLLAGALVPIYYAAFYFIARDTHAVFRESVVWLIWIPVWITLAAEALYSWRRARSPGAAHA